MRKLMFLPHYFYIIFVLATLSSLSNCSRENIPNPSNINNPPTALTISSTSVAENQESGAQIGTFSTIDLDTIDTHIYTLVEGDGSEDNISFTISGTNLLSAVVFDFETKNSYSIRVQTDDSNGGIFVQNFTITINNIDLENGDVNTSPIAIALSNTAINENALLGTLIGLLTTTDADASDIHSYTFASGNGDDDNSFFSLSNDSLFVSGILDYETDSLLNIRIQTDDGQGGTFQKTFVIKVNDIDEVIADINNDGELNILVIGTSRSIEGNSSAFVPDNIAMELENILSQDIAIDLEVNISFEDIYRSKTVTYGLGQSGTLFDANYSCHSLMQYYYWPDDQAARLNNLAGGGTHTWDYVVIAADPYIVAKLPGYYALGVNKIAEKIAEGGAKPLLLMVWPRSEILTASIDHFSEHTHRVADAAKVAIETIPSGQAWEALPSEKRTEQSSNTNYPTPNGAYLAAASIYAQIFNKSAASSDYEYDDEIAEVAMTTKTNEANNIQYTGERSFISPFKSCDIDDNVLNYNHTGTSSENGILNGLQSVIGQSNRTLVKNGTAPINFNYGRANTNFEESKRYNVDPTKFDFSLGFPIQDNGNHGNVSMLYGLDQRYNQFTNGTDLGAALYMVRFSELPNGRAIPIRTLFAQLREAVPSQSAYSDGWHMHSNLNIAIAAYMYTLLTGDCVLGDEPTNQSSSEWKTWTAHKIGYETAYTLMSLKGVVPSCN